MAAQKWDDLLKRDFTADAPNKKWITDITQVKTRDGNLYISAIFDCTEPVSPILIIVLLDFQWLII